MRDKRIRNLKLKLSRQIEDYLIAGQLKTEDALRQRLLVKAYQSRGASALFFREIKHGLAKLEAEGKRGADYFSQQSWLHHALYFYPDLAKYRAQDETYVEALQSLEYAFLHRLLYLLTEGANRQRLLQEETASQFLQPALEAARRCDPAKYPVARLFLLLAATTHTPDPGVLKKQVFDCEPFLSDFEKSLAFKMLLSSAIARANNGGADAMRTVLDLYKFGLGHGFEYFKGAMETLEFTNIAITGAAAGDLVWTNDFIKTYQSRLAKADRESAVMLCQAYFHYYRALLQPECRDEDFKAAEAQLSLIKRSSYIIEMRARPLQMRIAYDACHPDQFQDKMPVILAFASYFKEYLNRERNLSADKKNIFFNFIAFFKDLVNLRANGSAEQIADFKTKLESENNLAIKHWLLEKAAELPVSAA